MATGHDGARHGVDRGHAAEQHAYVRLVTEHATDRRRDIRGRQPGGCHLVEQRLKQVMIALIDQRHRNLVSHKLLRGRQSGETGTDHHDTRHRDGSAGFVHVKSLFVLGGSVEAPDATTCPGNSSRRVSAIPVNSATPIPATQLSQPK